MNNVKKIILEEYHNTISEGYDDVSMDYIKNKRKKLQDYYNYDDKKTIDNFTYLNFNNVDDSEDFYMFNQILVFDNEDGTEVANASYGKENENDKLVVSIDVRPDKRRKKIASNIYEWIEKLTNETIHPDKPHTKDAELFWKNPNRKFGPK
ncbi:MAG: hypothetical protein ACOC2W_01920 [bacterium]